MTREEYGNAYAQSLSLTIGFLVGRGVPYEQSLTYAHDGWTKGWTRIEQLRDPRAVSIWVNKIAFNLYRSDVRKQPHLVALTEVKISAKVNLAKIDTAKVLKFLKPNDRLVLTLYYLEDKEVKEIAEQTKWTETAVRLRLLRARRIAGKMLSTRRPSSHA